jgi:magnesium transporter
MSVNAESSHRNRSARLRVDRTSNNSPREEPGGHSVAFFTDVGHRGLAQHLRDGRFFWLDLEAPTDVEIEELGVRFGLHPLTVEDALTFDQRPKIEEYSTYAFMVLHGADPGVPSGEPLLHEVHLIISEQFVITLHRRPSAPLAELRARYETRTIRSQPFLIYKILQAVVNSFLPVLTRVAAGIDEIEAAVIADPSEDSLEQIFALKRHLVSIRQVVAPLRDVFAHNAERIGELPGLEGDGRLYFRDVYDSLIRISNLVDSYRDLTIGATDLYTQKVGNRQAEINKQLTMIATIFLPLTFLTGFFGQNFEFLINNIESGWGFLWFGLVPLALSTIGLWLFFRREGWIRTDAEPRRDLSSGHGPR